MLGDADNNGITTNENSRARQVGGRSSVDNDLSKESGANPILPVGKKDLAKSQIRPDEQHSNRTHCHSKSEGRRLNDKELAMLPSGLARLAQEQQIQSYGASELNKHVSSNMPKHSQLANSSSLGQPLINIHLYTKWLTRPTMVEYKMWPMRNNELTKLQTVVSKPSN